MSAALGNLELAAEIGVLREELRRLRDEVQRLHEDQHAHTERIGALEVGHQEHASELASLGVRLGEVQLTLDRLVSKVTTAVMVSERVEKQQTQQGKAIAQLAESSGQQTHMLQGLHAIMQDIAARLPNVVVSHG